MQIDLSTYPHTIRVASYGLITAGKHSAGKDDDPCFKSCILALYDKSLIALVLTPAALTSKEMVNTKAVTVAKNDFRIAES